MNQREIIETLEGYVKELEEILSRYRRDHAGWHIGENDHGRYSEIVHEVRDIFRDHIVGGAHHADQLAVYANDSISNFLQSPSHRGVENVKGLVNSVLVRTRRNPLAVASDLAP